MLATGDARGTLICSRARNRDTPIELADHVAGTAATEDQFALVSSGAGYGDAGGVIGSAFGVLRAINQWRTAIGTGSFIYETDTPRIITDKMLCSTTVSAFQTGIGASPR